MNHNILPLELALIRWSVVHQKWSELANDMPNLSAFLAGWFCRCIGTTQPEELGTFKDSFRAGWREADSQIIIQNRLETIPRSSLHDFKPDEEYPWVCEECGYPVYHPLMYDQSNL